MIGFNAAMQVAASFNKGCKKGQASLLYAKHQWLGFMADQTHRSIITIIISIIIATLTCSYLPESRFFSLEASNANRLGGKKSKLK